MGSNDRRKRPLWRQRDAGDGRQARVLQSGKPPLPGRRFSCRFIERMRVKLRHGALREMPRGQRRIGANSVTEVGGAFTGYYANATRAVRVAGDAVARPALASAAMIL